MSLRTSCWLFPQKEQYSSFSPPVLSDIDAISCQLLFMFRHLKPSQIPSEFRSLLLTGPLDSAPCRSGLLARFRTAYQDLIHQTILYRLFRT